MHPDELDECMEPVEEQIVWQSERTCSTAHAQQLMHTGVIAIRIQANVHVNAHADTGSIANDCYKKDVPDATWKCFRALRLYGIVIELVSQAGMPPPKSIFHRPHQP
jgi:hypothetical protein